MLVNVFVSLKIKFRLVFSYESTFTKSCHESGDNDRYSAVARWRTRTN